MLQISLCATSHNPPFVLFRIFLFKMPAYFVTFFSFSETGNFVEQMTTKKCKEDTWINKGSEEGQRTRQAQPWLLRGWFSGGAGQKSGWGARLFTESELFTEFDWLRTQTQWTECIPFWVWVKTIPYHTPSPRHQIPPSRSRMVCIVVGGATRVLKKGRGRHGAVAIGGGAIQGRLLGAWEMGALSRALA